MADAAGGGEDTWVFIPSGRCLMRYASENEREADIRHGKIEIGGIWVEKSFLRFDTKDEARHVHENLSKLEGDSFLKSCLIISHGGYWLAVDRFDCSLKRYCDKHPVCWNKSEVQLDPKDEFSDTNQKEVIIRKDEKHGDPNQKEVVIRYQLEPTYRQIVRDIITGIYQLHSQKYWHGDLSITDILIVNHRAKFAFLRGARVDPNKKKGVRGGSPDKRGEDFKKLRTVFKEVLGIANSGQNIPRAELKHFHNNAALKINNWPSLAKLFFHPLLMTPMQRFHLPVAMRTLNWYHLPKSQWLENCSAGAKWKENVRGDYKEILSYRKNNTQDQTEYIDDARGQLKFVRNTIAHFNDPQGKKVENATSSGGSNRPKKNSRRS